MDLITRNDGTVIHNKMYDTKIKRDIAFITKHWMRKMYNNASLQSSLSYNNPVQQRII